ncbi:MAG: hypothetical protein OXM61_07090 [Candidatus Poribacteria bacterium]|nr:hypothetical protein [Candidatus Poribacteria bacterium]
MMNQNYDDTRIKVLTENTAQGVFNHLKEMKSSGRHKRWIWELLQNARDVSPDADNHLITEVKYSGEELVFLHNGRGFTVDEIAHLIFYGSTKIEDERTIGQYGSGFLTTHLLSWNVNVSGQLDNGNWFNFCLTRKPESVQALKESMDRAWEAFKSSVTEARPESLPNAFTTQFVYPIGDQGARLAIEVGIETLKQCAPYVIISNPQFSRINIDFPGEKICFKAKPRDSDPYSVQQITVTENTNGNLKDKQYLLAQGDMKTSVTVPLESKDGSRICQAVEKIPRLFLGFPLVGTEVFSFPAVINSFKFTPVENRNGVYLGKNDDDENNTNQAVIEEACTLLSRLLQHAASNAWNHTHRWVDIPEIRENDWLNAEWLKEFILNKFIPAIDRIPIVLNETGDAMPWKEAILPIVENNMEVETLWGLLKVWKEYSEKLPRQVEAIEWCKIIKSWANILGDETSAFPSAIDGGKLAKQMVEKTKYANGDGHLENLQKMLSADISCIDWLNRLYGFLRDNEFKGLIHTLHFIPDQEGFFHSLSKLYRERSINDVLKEIAELLEWRIRGELRDLRFTALDGEDGPGYMESDKVVRELIVKLTNRSAKNTDDAFKKASVKLFGWIVSQKEFDRLSNFPMFAKDGESVLELSRADKRLPPLAPVCTWDKDLQPFEDLFPPDRILDNIFFSKVSDQEVWNRLNNLGIVRTNVIISDEMTNLNAFSLELQGVNEAHEATTPFSVTDFVERGGVMTLVTRSTERGRLFWKFITEYLINMDSQLSKTQMIKCKSCERTHKYYPAAWLKDVRDNQWIRQGDPRFTPDAKSLANLLQGSDWTLSAMENNQAFVEFLKAIRLTPSELKMASFFQSAEGNLEQYVAIGNIMRNMEAPEEELDQIIEELAERQERKQRLTVNQNLGLKVEKLVRRSLEGEGFDVKSVHAGADFLIIESDVITLDITKDDRKWWVEVKSARTESVKMSTKQTQKALQEEDNFLLCVVPIEENIDPDLEVVKKNMRFVKNISKKFGNHVTEFCEHIDKQEIIQANQDATDTGIELESEVGKAETRVLEFVWESGEAFPLENLKEKLR